MCPPVIPFVVSFLRRALARLGFRLSRIDVHPSLSISSFIAMARAQSKLPVYVVCIDNDTFIQSETLSVLLEGRLSAASPFYGRNNQALTLGSTLPSAPAGPFLALIDMEAFAFAELATDFPWLQEAEAWMLRAQLGSFWSGELDFSRLRTRIRNLDFDVVDVVLSPATSPLQAPSGNVTLVCKPNTNACPQSTSARYHTVEALTYLSQPVARRSDFRLLAGRGSFGFAAGVFNPGAIIENKRTFLLARAERVPWARQRIDRSLFFASAQPILLTLDADHCVTAAATIPISGFSESAPTRLEDFRLFRFQGKIFANHAVITDQCHTTRSANSKRLDVDVLRTRMGISELAFCPTRLAWHGFPSVDRPLTRTEKNWVMFADCSRLFLLYSFSPYILLSASTWPSLEFKTIVETRLTLPFDDDGLTLRNSINPVDYDDSHWLHIVHKVHPCKHYSYWGILIEKQSLRPVRTTAHPLVCGWNSCSASIIYTCSALVDCNDILLFSGLDDSSSAVAIIPRKRLDAEWVDIPTGAP